MGVSKGYTHGAQHVRRFKAARGAGRPGACADAEPVEHEQDGFAFHVFKCNIGGVGQAVIHIAVDHAVGDTFKQTLFKPVAQHGHADAFFLHVRNGKLSRCAKPSNVRHIFRTRTAAPFLMAAPQKRAKAHALAHVQHANTLGGVQLVAGERKHIRRQMGKVNGRFAHGLHGIRMEQHAALASHFSHALDRIDIAHLVVGKHDGCQRRIRREGGCVFVKVKASLVVHAKVGHPVALAFPVLHDAEHGGMFHAGGDEMALFRLGLDGRPDGGVVALRPAGGKDDFVRVCAQQTGHLLAGCFDRIGHLTAKGVHA